jgi:hypothetical protein
VRVGAGRRQAAGGVAPAGVGLGAREGFGESFLDWRFQATRSVEGQKRAQNSLPVFLRSYPGLERLRSLIETMRNSRKGTQGDKLLWAHQRESSARLRTVQNSLPLFLRIFVLDKVGKDIAVHGH